MSKISKNDAIKAELNYFYKKGFLKAHLHEITEQELAFVQLIYLVDGSEDEDYKAITEMISREIRRRFLNRYLDPVTSDFITDHYSKLAEKVTANNFKRSIVYCVNNEIDYAYLVKWCPIMMDVELVYKIHKYLKVNGFDDSEIYRIITRDSDKVAYFTQMVDRSLSHDTKGYEDNPEFKNFVNYTVENIKKSKSGTESYKHIIREEIENNKEVLRKLQ